VKNEKAGRLFMGSDKPMTKKLFTIHFSLFTAFAAQLAKVGFEL